MHSPATRAGSRNARPVRAASAAGAARAAAAAAVATVAADGDGDIEHSDERRDKHRTAARDVIVVACASVALPRPCPAHRAPRRRARTFATPEDAVRALIDAVKAGNLDEAARHLRPGRAGAGRLVGSGRRPAGTARCSRSPSPKDGGWSIRGAIARRSSSATKDGRFPVPLVRDANGWRFDTAAGKEEVLARRIGRNELAVIQICRTYVAAQRLYARHGTRWQARGPLRADLSQRSGQAERTVLAGRGAVRSAVRWATSWRRRPTEGRLGANGSAAVALSRLLLQDPDRAGPPPRPAARRTTSSTARCPAASRSSHGPRSTTSPAS